MFFILFLNSELRNEYSFIIVAPITVWVRPIAAIVLSSAGELALNLKKYFFN
jgi:hypothetical protein